MTERKEPTRAEFLSAYRDTIAAIYAWAADKGKLDRYMHSVEQTIAGKSARWICDGNALAIAWREVGLKGRPTLKKLRALMPCLLSVLVPSTLTGFVLLHQASGSGAPVTTVGYYSTESRCKHVAQSINGLEHQHGKAWCIPDDHELRDQGL